MLTLPPDLLELLAQRRVQQYEEMARDPKGKRGGWVSWEWEGQPRAFVFTQERGRPIPPRLDTTNWKRLLTAAGVDNVSRYTGRHTATCMMISGDGERDRGARECGLHNEPLRARRRRAEG